MLFRGLKSINKPGSRRLSHLLPPIINPMLYLRDVIYECNPFPVSLTFQNQMFRLNVEGQLTSGEWCANVDASGAINVQWCTMGSTDGPWEYRPEKKQVKHF